MTDDPFADKEPQHSAELPIDGWVYVRVGGVTLTAFDVDAGEELEVYALRESPRAADDDE